MQMNGFFPKWRIILFSALSCILTTAIIIRYGSLAAKGIEQRTSQTQTVERGRILDRNGRPLADYTNFYHMGISPEKIQDPEAFAHDVSLTLGMEDEEILEIIRNGVARKARFTYIKKKMPHEMFNEVRKITSGKDYSAFVNYDRIPGRIYPENSLASQLIGYMGDDGNGLAGIEYTMQSLLSPTPGPDEAGPVHGKNIYLTIDVNLQYKLDKIARAALEKTEAANLMLLAASAKTGEILSYISLPEANLNDYGNATIEEKIDRPAMTFFEPGSVFKVFSIAAAYDAGLFRQDESFYCDGTFSKNLANGKEVHINCLSHHGYLTARGALEQSCNDVTAQITDRMNTQAFLAKLYALGFGQKTNVELPGESAGLFPDTSSRNWSARSKMTISIGQEIGVTALQIIEAATALANEGRPIKLTFISQITNNDGEVVYIHNAEDGKKDRVLHPDTTRYILSCMQTGAEKGIGWRANLGDITIGVKTGTAQMADTVHGGYSDTDFLSDCLAFFPADKPEIILYIVIQKSKGINFASRIVAPVIKDSANAIIDYMGMSRDNATSLLHDRVISINEKPDFTMGKVVPDFTGMSKRDLLPLLKRTDLQILINGSGWVRSQNPEPGTPVTENMIIDLYLE